MNKNYIHSWENDRDNRFTRKAAGGNISRFLVRPVPARPPTAATKIQKLFRGWKQRTQYKFDKRKLQFARETRNIRKRLPVPQQSPPRSYEDRDWVDGLTQTTEDADNAGSIPLTQTSDGVNYIRTDPSVGFAANRAAAQRRLEIFRYNEKKKAYEENARRNAKARLIAKWRYWQWIKCGVFNHTFKYNYKGRSHRGPPPSNIEMLDTILEGEAYNPGLRPKELYSPAVAMRAIFIKNKHPPKWKFKKGEWK